MNGAGGLAFDVRRFSVHDGPGIRTTVFLKGCALSCPWCHNPEGLSFEPELLRRPERCVRCGSCAEACPTRLSGPCSACGACAAACPSGAREIAGRRLSVADTLALAKADEPYYGESGGGLTFSGGEPLAQGEFVMEAVKALSGAGYHTVIDTSGYAPEAIMEQAARHTDLFLYDLKYIDDANHRSSIGVSNKIILSNIRMLADNGADVVISFPYIPGHTASDDNVAATAAFVADLKPAGRSRPYPVRILPFHASARAKYARRGAAYACGQTPVPTDAELARAAAAFSSRGIETTIGGLS